VLHYRLHSDPKSSHQQIATLLRRWGRQPVLDVGAAQGFLGRLLQDAGLAIDAVEPNRDWAAGAAPYYRQVWPSTIEEAPLPTGVYRVVVCADVLEHTADPVAVLRHLRVVATDDALFVVSLPNVAHIAVRLLLLVGQFPRMERGILDRTHLHFYTHRTARALLADAGLTTLRMRPTGFPLDELWRRGEGTLLFRFLMRLQHLALLLAPTLFAWQWVCVARVDGTRIAVENHQ
jgi:2-polyprenyl-3-methyl-5-hydroxy-6-metoxy-1,4-benzoquinol methylase